MAEQSAAEGFFAAIAFEINQEKAAVLGKYGKKAEAAIERCLALRAAIDEGDTTAVEAYTKSRRAALDAIDKLCMQRELLGVYDNARVHDLYRVPPPLA